MVRLARQFGKVSRRKKCFGARVKLSLTKEHPINLD